MRKRWQTRFGSKRGPRRGPRLGSNLAKKRRSWFGEASGCEIQEVESQETCPTLNLAIDIVDASRLEEYNDDCTIIRIIGGFHILPFWEDADDALNSVIAWKWALKTFQISDANPEGVALDLFSTGVIGDDDYSELRPHWFKEKLTSSGSNLQLGSGSLVVPQGTNQVAAHDINQVCSVVTGASPGATGTVCTCTVCAQAVRYEFYPLGGMTIPFTINGGSSANTRWTWLGFNTRKRMRIREQEVLQIDIQADNVAGASPSNWQIYGGYRALVEF